ncbi:endonuclease/exonuclease/phosphatase family protein [Myxococcus sp. K15C18031901]|uniref:endonuclease/exonuclease/phosphatase family protein n=1 Tax=Myxococcus dinghuensis TaxID=2906761 RepID=UPI0020A70B79|nr:endonuclease/exonuclease/phosphatase family protein [Myxococcus dinghuensis]MCP3103921.1 endonuclease/exonuclease/phosphatase family protein [Myxococcus dinghuensis]
MTPFQTLRSFLTPLLAFAPLCLVACNDDDDDDQPNPTTTDAVVMTRNIYLGGDIFRLASATTPEQIPVVAAELYETVQATNFPERAKGLADEIQAANPALIGLQEVSIYRTQHPSDGSPPESPDATNVTYDFLAILMTELQSRGLNYRVAAKVQNADAELPAALSGNPTDLTDVRLTDQDVILTRGDVQIANVVTGNYDYMQEVPAGGTTLGFKRGFTKVDATLDGARFTFVNTHLEDLVPGNENQASELLGLVGAFERPVIVVGDMNTGPGTRQDAYDSLTGASTGLVDAWTRVGSGDGFTCCLSETVNDATPDFTQRIDLVLYTGDGIEPVSAQVVGNQTADRSASGLWPSDHAGLVVTFRLNR